MTIAEIMRQQAEAAAAEKKFVENRYAKIKADGIMQKPAPQNRIRAFFADRFYDDMPADKIVTGATESDVRRVIAKEQPEEYPVMGKPTTRKTFAEMDQIDVVNNSTKKDTKVEDYDRNLIMSAGGAEIEYVEEPKVDTKKKHTSSISVRQPSNDVDSQDFVGVSTVEPQMNAVHNRLLDALRANREAAREMMKD